MNRRQHLFRAAACAIFLSIPAAAAGPAPGKSVFLSSPRYTIDIGFRMTGRCDPYEGATFKHLDLYSSFSSIRFVASPSQAFGCWIEPTPGPAGGGIAVHRVQGRGEIRGFDICPAWEEEQTPIPARVTKGPAPFAPSLIVISEEEARARLENPADPFTPMPMVPSVWFKYTTGFSIKGDELAWEHENLSISQIEDYSMVFSVPVEELGKGKYISLEVPHADASESGTWSITISPLTGK